jgi:anti-anti-sigma factor
LNGEVLVTDTDASRVNGDADAWTPPGVEVRYAAPRSSAYAAIVSLYGEHDLDSHDTIATALEPIVGDVLLDLSDCQFIDSTVVGAIIAKSRELQHAGHRLELVAPRSNAHVTRVLDVIGMRALLTVHERAPVALSRRAPTIIA